MAFEREVTVAKELAEEAGALALDFQRRGLSPDIKADDSPVTAADRACEQLIVDRITREFPEDGILGEEGANRPSHNQRKWIIDPIDGTKDFIRGIPLWTVLIGLEQDGEIVTGAACCPGQRILAWASRGNGSFQNGERMQVSNVTDPSRAILSFNGLNKAGLSIPPDRLLAWIGQFWGVRGLGGSVDALLVASGRADVWIEPNAHPWDFAALKILVEEAGGLFRSLDGKNTIYAGNGWAATPGLEQNIRAFFES